MKFQNEKKILFFSPSFIRTFLMNFFFRNPYKPINDRYKMIFIHIPKCGGISIENALFQKKIGHSKIWIYKAFDKKKFKQYYKFTFVRNPWDRLVSAFFFLKAGGRNPKDTEWARKYIYKYDSFENFVLSLKNKKVRKIILNHQHFRPQHQYIIDENGRIPFDFIGRIEHFENDFETIKAQLGLTGDLSHTNKSIHKPYSHYYNQETKNIVANIYKEDIELLNYSFDRNL